MIPETRKKAAVLGLRDTGYASALFLHQKGYQVFASDISDSEEVRENVRKLKGKKIEAESGAHSFEKILDADWALISPGVPPASEIYQRLKLAHRDIYSEIEVASWFSSAKTVVAVTGSCGKTTIATMIADMVKAQKKKVVLCGNIGNPWIGELSGITADTVTVLELSSFQLMHCKTFAPSIGLLLNLYPNHMDWHRDMRDYASAKLNLFRSMKSSDLMICRKTDEESFFPDFAISCRRVYFDKRKGLDPNEAVLSCVAEALECPEAIAKKTFENFPGIEHRLERFKQWNGIIFINDSKSTTPASLRWALEKCPDQRVVLIAGGHPKSADFENLTSPVHRKVHCAILIGEAGEMIRKAWNDATKIIVAASLDDACVTAIQRARAGDTVLLSPACASFDMFKNYQERGKLFKEKILNILMTKDKNLEKNMPCQQ